MKLFGKKQSKLLLVAMCVSVMCATHAFSKPKSESVKEETGYYYGYGKAATEQDAMAIAKKDLIENALTATLRLKNPKASRVIISDEVANARLSNIKAQYPNSKNKLNLYYRISVRDWERDEKAYDEKLRSSLTTRYNSLSARGSSASKIETAVSILNELAINGKTELLTLQAVGTELFSRKVESICKSIVDGLVFTISTKNGIIRPDTNFSVKVAESSGSPVSNLSVKAVWELPGLSIHREGEEVHEVVSVVKTDAQGNAKIDYPVSDSYKNRIVCLTVSTAFSMSETATTEMRMLDAACSTEGHFVHYEDLETAYKSFVVEAGEYKTGKVVHDRRAVTGKEDERDAKLESFAIDLYPVTNMQYAAYLYTTDSLEEPEYFANSDYNNELQPV
ncbi:MAG: hypothetical protein IJR49_02020, partial [Treponema sp.]|nr:hypothetical protein [Treponema sp.]